MTDDMPSRDSWHLDKRVPVSLILALLVQAGAFIWWGSGLTSRVSSLEAYVAETKQMGTGDRLVRLETLMGEIQKTLQNIDRKLDGVRYQPGR